MRLGGAQGKKTNSAPPLSNRRPHGRSLAPLWSNLSSFEGKFTVLKTVLVTLLGLFGAPAVIMRPHSESANGELCLLAPRYAPVVGKSIMKK